VTVVEKLLLRTFLVIDDKGGEEHGLKLVLTTQFLSLGICSR
jgi:hypothetical protein